MISALCNQIPLVNYHLLYRVYYISIFSYSDYSYFLWITCIYIYAFSRRIYPKRLTVHSGYTFFISMCGPWESNPQHFVLLTQCSTTEPQEHAYSSFTQWQLIFHNLVNLPNTSFLFKKFFSRNPTGSFSFEWMNEWCIYIALYSVLLYTQCALQSCGGEGHSSTTTSAVQHPLGWCDGCHRTTAPVHSLHTSYRWRG